MHFKNQLKKNSLKVNKSLDDINIIKYSNENSNTSRNIKKLKQKKNNLIPSEGEKYKKNEENDNYQWKNSLLSLKPFPRIIDTNGFLVIIEKTVP